VASDVTVEALGLDIDVLIVTALDELDEVVGTLDGVVNFVKEVMRLVDSTLLELGLPVTTLEDSERLELEEVDCTDDVEDKIGLLLLLLETIVGTIGD